MTMYETSITETRTATIRCIVDAGSVEEAQRKTAEGDFVLATDGHVDVGGVVRSTDTAVVELPERGAPLRRVEAALDKPDAFTIHARLWGLRGLGEEAEYHVYSVSAGGLRPGIDLGDFPDSTNRRFVPEKEIFGLRIDSESDEVTYEVSNIRYDTDGGTAIVDLPETLNIDLPRDTEDWRLEDMLADAISERTGWCHNGFDYKVAA